MEADAGPLGEHKERLFVGGGLPRARGPPASFAETRRQAEVWESWGVGEGALGFVLKGGRGSRLALGRPSHAVVGEGAYLAFP